MSLDFELAQAEAALEKAKREAHEYLALARGDSGVDWYQNFELVVQRIMRREKPCFNFGPGGYPTWYAEALRLLGAWIAAEHKHCGLLARKSEGVEIPPALLDLYEDEEEEGD